MKRKNLVYILVSAVIAFGLLYSICSPVIHDPNEYLFVPRGDGIKNYYTAAYYIKYDEGSHFTGMNYPFGENVVYTDNQPVLAWLLSQLQHTGIKTGDYLFGVFNIFMLFSLLPCVVFLYLILRDCGVPLWYAAVASVGIGLLSPQFDRITGHYALSYLFVVPMFWWIILRLFHKNRPVFWGLIYIGGSLFFAFIHLYYLALLALFLSTYAIVWGIQQWRKKAWRFVLFALIIAVVPVLLAKGWLAVYDTITDRPSAPYGLFSYTASLESIFLSDYELVKNFISQLWNISSPRGEGWAYIGIAGVLTAALSLFRLGHIMIKKKWLRLLKPALPQPLATSLIAAVLILLFAMGIPYKLGLSHLFDLVPALRQFRSLGRFAWIFYYVFTVYSAFALYWWARWLKTYIKPGWKKTGILLLPALISLLWTIEGWYFLENKFDYIYKMNGNPTQNDFLQNPDYAEYLKQDGYQISDFQAILPAPFFLVGSEVIHFDSWESTYYAMKTSYHTGLPIASTMLSRTSLSQTSQLTQLFSSPLIEKKLLSKISAHPFLLLKTSESSLWQENRQLVKHVDTIYKSQDYSLFSLDHSVFRSHQNALIDSFEKNRHKFYKGDWYLADSGKPQYIHYRTFEKNGNTNGFLSEKGIQAKNHHSFSEEMPLMKDTTSFEMSFWLKVRNDMAGFPRIRFRIYDAEGKEILYKPIYAKKETDILSGWIRVSTKFNAFPRVNKWKLSIKGSQYTVDRLLIRPLDLDLYHEVVEDSSSFWMNNYYFNE